MGLSLWEALKWALGLWPFVGTAVGLLAARFMKAGSGSDDIQAIEDYANVGGER